VRGGGTGSPSNSRWNPLEEFLAWLRGSLSCRSVMLEGALEEKGIHLSAADHEYLEEAGIYQGVRYLTFLNP